MPSSSPKSSRDRRRKALLDAVPRPMPRPLAEYPDLLRSDEVGEILRCHEKTVRTRASGGLLPPPCFFKPNLWRKTDIARHIAQATESGARRRRHIA